MHRHAHTLPLALLLAAAATVAAQVVPVPAAPQIGSSNPVSPEPALARPTTAPCSVPLLTEQAFADFSNKPLTYTPPAACPGPWAKVVFSADFTVTTGRQFDRTAKFFLGGANIYFGTTAEPRAALSPSWHVERDITDLSALLHAPQVGQAILGNFVGVSGGVRYNGIIYANARVDLYPADSLNPAPAVPNAVLAFPTNDTARVSTTADTATGTFTFPRNLERLYLDVIAQSQATDEFWYLSVPNDVASELQSFGNTAFRETEIAIDGTPAGTAPVYPWIYTGGIDPYLWEPIPGIQTLNFQPFRVNLTPFAGILADGKPHTVAVSVFNANSGFDVASTLLLYTAPAGSVTTGALTANTLTAAPAPQVTESLNTAADGTVSGTVGVTSSRAYTVSGYTTNSATGRVDTTVETSSSFGNLQDLKVAAAEYKQDVTQNTELHELTTTRTNTGTVQTQRDLTYPLIVNYRQPTNADGSFSATTYVKQGNISVLRTPLGPNSPDPVATTELLESTDTLLFSPSGALTGRTNTHTAVSYGAKDAEHRCYYQALTADASVLTEVNSSTSCSLAP